MNKRVCKNCESGAKFCETWRKYSGEYTCRNPESHNHENVMRANVGCNKFKKRLTFREASLQPDKFTARENGIYEMGSGRVPKLVCKDEV